MKDVCCSCCSDAKPCPTLCDPMDAVCQISLSFSISQILLKPMSIELVMLSNNFILCCPLLLLSIIPNTEVFSSESALPIRWPVYWSFSFSSSPSNEYSGLISFRIDWFASPRDSQESSPVPQFKSIDSSGAKFSNHEFPQGSPWSVAK